MYRRGAIFEQDLNFFVHSSRLFVEISYLCHRILQRVQDILLICSLELRPRKESTSKPYSQGVCVYSADFSIDCKGLSQA